MTKALFRIFCKTMGIPFVVGNKICDARYKHGKKSYLSAIDDKYYSGDTAWSAKAAALSAAVTRYGPELTISKLYEK